MESQDGRCAICRKYPLADELLHVDHDHATGAVRGLLCLQCNAGLGYFKDNVGALAVAIKYLSPGEMERIVAHASWKAVWEADVT